MKIAATVALVTATVSIVTLGLLHVLSPEFDPSWRMISEYANGNHGWLLSLFFAAWGISSFALLIALRSALKTTGGKVGLVFLGVAGAGQILAAIFDINHPLHDLVGNIAIPAFAVAAVLITKSLKKSDVFKTAAKKLAWLAHASWISVLLLVVSFVTLISTYMASGAPMSEGAVVATIPEGVIAVVGWMNRLLVLVFTAWTIAASAVLLKK